MERELKAFVSEPSATTYLALRTKAAALSRRPIGPQDVHRLVQLLEREQWPAIGRAIARLPSLAVVSPAIHAMAAEAARAAGDEEDYALERELLAATLQGICGTGDGTLDRPYLAACAADQPYVCRFLGLVPRRQSVVNHRGQALDVVECEGDREICFDVSLQVPLPQPKPEARPTAAAKARRTPACRRIRRPLTRTTR